jgi:hypothetical protein
MLDSMLLLLLLQLLLLADSSDVLLLASCMLLLLLLLLLLIADRCGASILWRLLSCTALLLHCCTLCVHLDSVVAGEVLQGQAVQQ